MVRSEYFSDGDVKLRRAVRPLGLVQANESTSVFQNILDRKTGKVVDGTLELDVVCPSAFEKEDKGAKTEGIIRDKFI